MNFFYAVTSDINKYLGEHPWAKIQNIQPIVTGLINLILVAAVVVFVFLILIAGVQWITAGGDKEALSSAQKRLTAALIGITIVFSAWAIINLTKGFFGLEKLKGTAPPASSATPTPSTKEQPTSLSECRNKVCREIDCKANWHDFRSFCYKNCRCICDGDKKPWAYENPWFEDGKQYACLNGTKQPY